MTENTALFSIHLPKPVHSSAMSTSHIERNPSRTTSPRQEAFSEDSAGRLDLHHSTSDSEREQDIFAEEFAQLVNRYTPSQTEAPSEWLSRLPTEVFKYYRRGIATFGEEATAPIERRGRLYLMHTALVFMWMSWGKTTARERFQAHSSRGTQRAASIIILECYRRAGKVMHYGVPSWFYQPVEQWSVALISAAIQLETVSDPTLKAKLAEKTVIRTDVSDLSTLRAAGALPSLGDLSIDSDQSALVAAGA